jgi:hypothetical protein
MCKEDMTKKEQIGRRVGISWEGGPPSISPVRALGAKKEGGKAPHTPAPISFQLLMNLQT